MRKLGSLLSCAILLHAAVFQAFAERLPIRIYTSADGLGSSATFNLVRDSRGFIWLCSRDGLVRFDGYRFITYKIGDDTADPAVFNLQPTRSGAYWINLNRGTDYRFVPKPDEDKVEPLSGAAVKNDLRVPISVVPKGDEPLPNFEDDDGNLWTANDKGIFLMKEMPDGKFELERNEIRLPGSPKPEITTIGFSESRGPGFWVGTQWGMTRRLPDGRTFHVSIDPKEGDDTVNIFAEDADSRVWIARPDGMIVIKTLDPGTLSNATELPDRTAAVTKGSVSNDGRAALPQSVDQGMFFSFPDIFRSFTTGELAAPDFYRPIITAIICGADGRVWIATNNGLVMHDGERFYHYTRANGLASDFVSSMVEDNEGYIWLATYGGLHRLNPKGLTTFAEADGLENERYHAIYEDANGELNVVFGNAKIAVFRDGKFRVSRPAIPTDAIFGWLANIALLDRRGDWWLATTKNFYHFTGVKNVEQLNGRAPSSDLSSVVGDGTGTNFKVLEDSHGSIWISTMMPGSKWLLNRFVDGRKVASYEASKIFEGASGAIALSDDGTGGLWFAFNEGGLARFRDGVFSKIETDNSPAGGVTGIYRDLSGRLWISTSREGLYRVDEPAADRPVFRRYTVEDGLTSNNTRCVTEDLFGNIYIGTVRGINRLDLKTGRLTYFGTADGLASDFVNTAFRDHTGTLWFGTMNGLSKYVPTQDVAGSVSDVLISGLKVAGEDYSVSPVGQRVVNVADLSPGQNSVQIDFLSVRTGGTDVRYQYKLDDVDRDWGPPTTQGTVTFANLLPGTHRFLVRVVGNEANSPAVVDFTILRPFWQQWWFLLALALAMATAIYLIYRYRLAQLLKLERVRTRIASDLHDDIGSSLSQIAILTEVVRRRVGENGVSEPLGKIADTSREMVDSMSDIVWAINPARDRLGDLLKRMRRFATDLLDASDIELRFRIPQKIPNVHLDSDLRRELYLVFKEAVNNVARHSGAKCALIGTALSGDTLQLTIADDGRGFDVSAARGTTTLGGNGLINMQRRIARLGGEIVFDSTPDGGGTKVKISVPIVSQDFIATLKGMVRGSRK